MNQNIFFIGLMLFLMVSCSKPDQKQIERLIKEQVLVKTNRNAMSIKLKEEANDQFLASITLENGQVMELIFKGNLEKYELTETLNSETMRQIGQMLGVNCTDMALKAKDSTSYEGTAKLQSGETLNLHVEPKNGWYPTDEQSLGILLKYQLKQYAQQNCQNVTLQKLPEGNFKGKATFENGKTLDIVADFQNGWFVANDLNSMLNAIGFQINAQKLTYDTLFAKPLDSVRYEGELITEKGTKRFKLMIQHLGSAFDWKVEELSPTAKK